MKLSRKDLTQIAAIMVIAGILAIPISVRVKNSARVPQTHEELKSIFALHNAWESQESSLESEAQKHADHLTMYTRGVRIKTSKLGRTVVPWLDFGHVVPYQLELEDGRLIEGEYDSKAADWGYLWVKRGSLLLSDAQMLEFDKAAARAFGEEARKQKQENPQLEWVMIASDNEEFRRNSMRLLLAKEVEKLNMKLVGLRFPQEKPTLLLYPSVWRYGRGGVHIEAESNFVGTEATNDLVK